MTRLRIFFPLEMNFLGNPPSQIYLLSMAVGHLKPRFPPCWPPSQCSFFRKIAQNCPSFYSCPKSGTKELTFQRCCVLANLFAFNSSQRFSSTCWELRHLFRCLSPGGEPHFWAQTWPKPFLGCWSRGEWAVILVWPRHWPLLEVGTAPPESPRLLLLLKKTLVLWAQIASEQSNVH